MARGRQVIATVKHGWTVRDHARLDFAEFWNRLSLPVVVLIRAGLFFVRSPIRVLGTGLFLAGVAAGLPWQLALILAVGVPLWWRVRRVLRVFVYPSRDIQPSSPLPSNPTGLRKRVANAWTAYRRWRQLDKLWPEACMAAGIVTKREGEPRIPALTEVRVTETGIAADVATGSVGWSATRTAAQSETLAATILGCRAVTVTQAGVPGWTTLHFQWADPLSRIVTPDRLALPQKGRLAFGVTEDDDLASIAMFKSLLVVGVPGSGKSSTAWALLASAIATGTPFMLRVIDPKGGVELHALKGSPLVRDYARDEKSTKEIIDRAYRAMKKREELLERTGKRMHTPTPAEPLEILLIDELLLLPGILKEGTASKLGQILIEGRATANVVWALTQIPHIDTVGRIRNLFVQKLVLATESPDHTDAVLPGAESSGAKASRIPESTPGIGYAQIEGIRGYQRFRSVYFDDELIRVIASGYAPPGVPINEGVARPLDSQPHVLYAWYSPEPEMELLYVGISNSSARRAVEHLANAAKEELAQEGVTMHIMARFEGEDARQQALAAEEAAIKEMRPKLNKIHNR